MSHADKYRKYLLKMRDCTDESKMATYKFNLNKYHNLIGGDAAKKIDDSSNVKYCSTAKELVAKSRKIRSDMKGGSASSMRAFMEANADNPQLVNNVVQNLEHKFNANERNINQLLFKGGSASSMRAFIQSNGDNPEYVKNVISNYDGPSVETDNNGIDRLFLTGGADETDCNLKIETEINELEKVMNNIKFDYTMNPQITKNAEYVETEMKKVAEDQAIIVSDIIEKLNNIDNADKSKTEIIIDLREKLKKCEEEKENILNGTSGNEDELARLQQENEDLKAQIAELESQLEEEKAKATELESTLANLENEHKSITDELSKVIAAKEVIEAQLNDAENANSSAEELNKENEKLNNLMTELEEMNAQLEKEITKLNDELTANNGYIKELEDQIATNNDQFSSNTTLCEELEKQLEDATLTIQKLTQQLVGIDEEIDELISANKTLTDTLDDVIETLDEANIKAKMTLENVLKSASDIESRQKTEINSGILNGGAKSKLTVLDSLLDTEDMAKLSFTN